MGREKRLGISLEPRVIDRRDSISPRIMKFSRENGTISRPCDPLFHSIVFSSHSGLMRRNEITDEIEISANWNLRSLFFFF